MWLSDGAGGFLRNWLGIHRTEGAVVPFEAPALRRARVCKDEHDSMIAILRDFANNGATYIVPWSSLPLMANMTDHDSALHKGIEETRPSNPAEVRAVVSQLALAGALGQEAKARELKRRQDDQTHVADVELILVLHLLNSSGADLSAVTVDSILHGEADVRAMVAAASVAVGISRQDIYPRVTELTKLLAPVGLPTIHPGWLRVERDEIETFSKSCIARCHTGSPDMQASLTALATAAGTTAQLAGTVLSLIDYALLDISTTISRWPDQQAVLGQVIERLSLLLDEWPSLMTMVRDALRKSQGDQAGQLRTLLATLPHVPEVTEQTQKDGFQTQHDATSVSQVLGDRLTTIWCKSGVSTSKNAA
jgi:hypothetical protein